ncbi:MAG TPA: DUF5597 domain-containing protein [Mucilaginibacter sp.]
MIKKTFLSACFLLCLSGYAFSQQAANPIPQLIQKDGRHALLVDGAPYLILGGQVHNSNAWPAMFPGVWSAVKEMHANTLEIPVYWEQVEPEPGKFNFSIVDILLSQARQHQVRLVFLWFGTWKNGSNHYMPEWMKRDASKYPNVAGRNGKLIDSPSPHFKATLEADIKAFTSLTTHLKEADPQHTVIMMQVENEPGTWDSVRDFSATAQKLFEGKVPEALLKPEVLKSLNVNETKANTWQSVFGDRADEYFHAWHVANYIGQVVAAGKKAYPLPMYVNAALRDPLTNPPATHYESGGATDNVIPIWKAAAPAIDLLAPDIYLSGSERVLKVIDLYHRPDNVLFVPEAGLIPDNAKYLYSVIANNGIGFSPFGIDENTVNSTHDINPNLVPFAHEYESIAPMMRELAKWDFEGKVDAVVEHEDHMQQTIDLGSWQAIVTFGERQGGTVHPNKEPSGKLMIVRLGEDEFLLTGTLCSVKFIPLKKNAGRAWQYLKVEEGQYDKGQFKMLRILNGDETDWGGPQFGSQPTVLRATLVVR